MSALAMFLKKQQKQVQRSIDVPDVMNEQAMADATKRARSRRGFGSTLLAGDMNFDDMNVRKNRLLGG
jgi:hypothetical protein